jgi:rhodanese-related sulfurtransferase
MRNADEIIPRVWLGNRYAAVDDEWLRKNEIDTVFNCTKDLPFHESIENRYRVPVDDDLTSEEINNMSRWSPEIAYKILREYKKGKNILVHCAAGMQRSAAAVTFFLITLTGETAPKLMSAIRKIRPIAFVPSANFNKSISYYDNLYHNDIKHRIHEENFRVPNPETDDL